MKRIISIVVMGLAASLAFAGAQDQSKKHVQGTLNGSSRVKMVNTPLNAALGLWQITQTVNWTGLPPQTAAMMNQMSPTVTYKSCVKKKDLSTNPWAEGSHEKCTWTALSSTGTDMDVQATSCKFGDNDKYPTTADLHGHITMSDSEHGTGKFDVTMNAMGQTMHGTATYTGTWVGATCPAGMK